MSRLVDQDYWSERLGDMPMPEGATLEMAWAAFDAVQEIERQDDVIKMLGWYQKQLDWYSKKDPTNPHNIENIKLIEDSIEALREQLNG